MVLAIWDNDIVYDFSDFTDHTTFPKHAYMHNTEPKLSMDLRVIFHQLRKRKTKVKYLKVLSDTRTQIKILSGVEDLHRFSTIEQKQGYDFFWQNDILKFEITESTN